MRRERPEVVAMRDYENQFRGEWNSMARDPVLYKMDKSAKAREEYIIRRMASIRRGISPYLHMADMAALACLIDDRIAGGAP